MARVLPPPPFKVPFVDDKGLITDPWQKWIRDIFAMLNSHEAELNP